MTIFYKGGKYRTPMSPAMNEIYYLILVYNFSVEVYKNNEGYVLRLHNPDKRYWTEYRIVDGKIKQGKGVNPWYIFTRKKGYPP